MTEISSGDAALDTFLAGGYQRVRGMSSRFAAAICGYLLGRQTALGISGDIMEIGTFEGRFFIAMAMLLQRGEHALGIDVFSWPEPGVYDRFVANCSAAGLKPESFTAWKADTRAIATTDILAKLPNQTARFIHVDGEHNAECLSHDLELAHAALHPAGVIALDDMLHPGYPALIVPVLDYLSRHREMRALCIIDRESITAAAKLLLCRVEAAAKYERDLMTTFARFHYTLGAQLAGTLALVLTPDPRLPEIS